MSKQKINRIILFINFLFIFSCCHFFPVKAEEVIYQNEEWPTQLDINVDTTWHKDDNLTFNKRVTVYSEATLTIEKGAQIKFGRNEEDNSFGYLDIFGGRVIANGTQDEPIKISTVSQSDKFVVEFNGVSWDDVPMAEPSFLRYVEISGGGHAFDVYNGDGKSSFLQTIIPSAYATDNGYAAMHFLGGKMHLENCRFSNNDYADVGVEYEENEKSIGSYLEIVNSNFEKKEDENEKAVIVSSIQCINNVPNCVSVLLKNNWYGGELGPNQGNSGNGKEISGELILDGWRTNSLIADPAIIIPGIMGSTEVSGQLKLDPILHIYDDLLKSLITNGYKKDSNLFEFLYDWRKKNADSALLLKTKVENIINSTKISKVDLVAHSMGGLIARSYIENEGYQNIDQLITLGTPHRGSPEAYLKWEAGEGFFTLADKITRNHFEAEAKHNGYESLFAYVVDKVPSTKELLPDYSYLYDTNKSSLRNYSNNYPRNTFLENLNAETSLEKLKKVDFTNIIGVTKNNQSTISKINVVNSTVSWKWNDGMPNNFYDESTDKGLEYSKGDETVPERSAEDILADKTLKTNSTHNNLPTVAQCAIFQELTGIENECKSVVETHIPNILLINIFSPIDIQLIDPNGKKMGKDFEHAGQTFNEISGAFYSGYETENEFITIPNPIDGEYKITSKGTGSGEYKIEVAKISEEDDSAQSAKESLATFTGTATSGGTETVNAIVNGDRVEDKNKIATTTTTTTTTTTANSISDDNTKHKSNSDNNNNKKTKTKSNSVETFLAKDNRQSIDPNFDNPLKNANNIFADASKLEKTFPNTEVSGAETKTKNKFNKFWIILGIIIGGGVSWFLVRRKKFWCHKYVVMS